MKAMLDKNVLEFCFRYVHDNLPSDVYSFWIVTKGIHQSSNTHNQDQFHVDRTGMHFADIRIRIYPITY